MSLSLPTHLTDFIGRRRELDDVSTLVASLRLVTLTGAGGSGKTRLAAEVAARIDVFPRVQWVDLAPLADAAGLTQHVAEALQVPDRPATPCITCIVDALAPGKILLVLDNCEHVVDAAAKLVETLLRACPDLSVLTTSRSALGVPG